MTDIDTSLNVWQMTTNHNRMIELQADRSPPRDGPVEIAYYGSSAFRITSPNGVSVMIDPWRNHPSRRWDWYFHDFPVTATDIGTSTHAHFDHDALAQGRPERRSPRGRGGGCRAWRAPVRIRQGPVANGGRSVPECRTRLRPD